MEPREPRILVRYVDMGIRLFDCVGLIKAFLWDDDPSNYKASEDENEVMMYDRAKVKGMIASMPERPGILVFMPYHVGVYIENGYVVECTRNMPLGGWGVLKTKFAYSVVGRNGQNTHVSRMKKRQASRQIINRQTSHPIRSRTSILRKIQR